MFGSKSFKNRKIPMTKSLQNRLIYFFVFVLIITFLGFYKTYLIKFPTFEGFTNAHHIHGALALSWILMLIAQPILIQRKMLYWHRLVGKISYVTMPLLLLSLFFVAKAGYQRNIATMPEIEALAGLTNGMPDMVFMGSLYSLALYYKKKTAFHLRFMSATGLMILGPGLGRFLIVFCGLPFQIAIPLLISFSGLIALVWLIADIRQKKSAFPMGYFLLITLMAVFINANSHSSWWLGFAKWVVTHLY
jgi:hypothetical protein